MTMTEDTAEPRIDLAKVALPDEGRTRSP